MSNVELYFLIQNIGTFIGIGIIGLLIAIVIIASIYDKISDLKKKIKEEKKNAKN